MPQRLTFILLAAFFVTMNAVLWRAEFAGQGRPGAEVPVELVWLKMLTAPDNSALDVLHHGRKSGFCRWAPNVGEELATGKLNTEEYVPEDMVRRLSYYTLDFEGNIALDGPTNRLGFSLHLRLSTNQTWQHVFFRINLRPYTFSIRSEAAAETLTARFSDSAGGTDWHQTFRFDELQRPDRLIESVGGPMIRSLLGGMIPSGLSEGLTHPPLNVRWEARQDWLRYGRSRIRAYRLRAQLLNRHEIVLFVSPVGEILRTELPDGWVLLNDALPHL